MQYLREFLLTETLSSSWILHKVWPQVVRTFLHVCHASVSLSKTPYRSLERHLSDRVTNLIQQWIVDQYGDRIYFEGRRIKTSSVRFVFKIHEGKTQGYHGGYNKNVILLSKSDVDYICSQVRVNVNDDDVDVKQELERDLSIILDTITHEITHLQQALAFSNKGRVEDFSSKSLITSVGRRGEYTGPETEDKEVKYVGFPIELDAYSSSVAAKVVRSFTKHINKDKQPELWNEAIDRALAFIVKDKESLMKISSSFKYVNDVISKALQQEGKFSSKQLDRVWKRFLKTTYIRIESYKE